MHGPQALGFFQHGAKYIGTDALECWELTLQTVWNDRLSIVTL